MAIMDLLCSRGGSRHSKLPPETLLPRYVTDMCSQLCVSIPAIRPLLAIYFPRLLESSRPTPRAIKSFYDSNELSDQSGSGSTGSNSVSKESGKYFDGKGDTKGHVRDLESGSKDHIEVGNETHPMEYTDVPKAER